MEPQELLELSLRREAARRELAERIRSSWKTTDLHARQISHRCGIHYTRLRRILTLNASMDVLSDEELTALHNAFSSH